MNSVKFHTALFYLLALLGIILLFSQNEVVSGEATDSIVITEADASRKTELTKSDLLNSELAQILPRIIVAFSDALRTEELSYPLGMLGDTTPPVVANLQATVNKHTATITWTTNEFAKSVLRYGTQSGLYANSVSKPLYEKSHSVVIDTLTVGVYYFVIESTDRDNNSGTTSESSFVVAPGNGLSVVTITPHEGVVGQPITVVIRGNGFSNGMNVSLQQGTSHFDLASVNLQNTTQLQAVVPATLPSGLYDLLIEDSTNQKTVLPNAFSLLANTPTLLQVIPSQGVNDLANEITIYGNNFAVGASVSLSGTALSATRLNGNQLQAIVPAGLSAGTYDLSVINPGNQRATLANGYTVYDSTSNNDLFGYSYEFWSSPSIAKAGETTQIGLFVHRHGGKSTLPNVKVRFLLGDKNGTQLGESAIPFLDTAAGFGGTPGLNTSFAQAGEFVLTAIIDPDNGVLEDNENNNVITRTIIVAPTGPDRTPPLINKIRVNDDALETTTTAVDVEINASDPSPNATGMRSVTLIEYVFNTSANQWVPIQQSGWLPYNATPDSYLWTLRPIAGIHYLQARALDNGENISVGAARQQISYVPPTDSLGRGQTRIYRYEVTAGQQLDVKLKTISGDPDLYVWSSSLAQSAHVSNSESGDEHVLISADAIVPGIYQIEVYGFTTTEYQMIVEIGQPTTETTVIASNAQPNAKTLPTQPLIALTNTPDERQGTTPPIEVSPTVNEQRVFLPLVTR